MEEIISSTGVQLSFWVSFGFTCAILIIALVSTCILLGFSQGKETQRSLLVELLMEKNGNTTQLISFARVSGLLGSMALTALFVSVVFWVQYAIFFDKSLEPLSKLWPAFAVGSALFAPYAFNQIMKVNTPGSA